MVRIITGLVLGLVSVAAAGSGECPAEKATARGFDPIGAFHEVVAQVWHQAYPDKDFTTLMAAAPRFETALAAVMQMQPAIGNRARKERFEKARAELAAMVQAYAAAAAADDRDSVYALVPPLHEAFEQTASALVPGKWTQIDGMAVTTRIVLESHLPEKNWKALTACGETLAMQAGALDEKCIPEALMPYKAELLKEFERIRGIVAEYRECCERKDAEALAGQARLLQETLDRIAQTYL